MSYQKQNFANGEVLTASQLNHIENGIADVESTANTIKGVVDKIIDPTLSVSGKAADAAKVGEAVNAEVTRAKAAEEENAKGVSQLKEEIVDQKKNNIVFNGYFKEYNDRIANNNNIIKSILSKKETILTEENGSKLIDRNNNSPY